MQAVFDINSYGHSAFSVPIGVVGVLALVIGLWVVWHEGFRTVSLSFLAVALSIGTYLGGFSLMVGADSPAVGLFWGRVAYLGVPFIVPSLYQFSMDLLGLRERRRVLIAAAWGVGLVYMTLAVGTTVLVESVFRMEWGYITRISRWNLVIIGFWTVLLVLAVRDYLRAYREATAVQRARIRFLAIPIVIGSLAFVDYAPSLGVPVAPWGFVVFALFLVSAAWTVARYHLPDLTPAFAADQIVATMADPLIVCDDSGNIAFANPATSDLLGWGEGSLVGQPLDRLLPAPLVEDLLTAGGGHSTGLQLRTRDGDLVDVVVTASGIHGKRGRRVGTVVVARDVREARAATRELERREQRFRALIEHARDTITIIDEEGGIVYESPSTRVLLGYDPEEAARTSLLARVHPADRAAVRAALERTRAEPDATMEGEARVRDAEGRYHVFEYLATNLVEHPGVGGIVINARDITEQRQLDAQLQQAQKMEAIGRLAGGVAHDFNNILTAVQGNVALLLDQLDADDPMRAELGEIRTGAERAGRLTDQLLAFSRRQVLQPRVLSLNAIVREMHGMLERLIGENVRLLTDAAALEDSIRMDRGQLEQILLNLVVNARDAIDGAGRIRIGTRYVEVREPATLDLDFLLDPGSYVVLTVEDDGAGMDEETRARLFEPFFTTKGDAGGTGLGLSTVYGAVRQAAGYIGVESEPGQGTTFSVHFPVAEAPAETAGHGAEPADPGARGGGEVILVVEDEDPVRSLIVRVLERRGYRVLQAGDGREALRVARDRTGPIDLLISDLVMPGLSGREVADRLTDDQPGMAVIFISGYTADEVLRRDISDGGRQFLPKPFTPDDLTKQVAATLSSRRVDDGRACA